jgi:hypothetical protein
MGCGAYGASVTGPGFGTAIGAGSAGKVARVVCALPGDAASIAPASKVSVLLFIADQPKLYHFAKILFIFAVF